MMDFDNVLSIATQNRGSVQKRYSLQVGPPKKDPRSKGVNPAAVQALLKRRQHEARAKEIEMKKQKQDLVAKRVELKSDRKARAMASRTKDNFRGYNGIPVVEGPKKRRTKQEMEKDTSGKEETFQNVLEPEDDEDNYEYDQTDSEPDQDPEPLRPPKISAFSGSSGNSSKLSPKKPSGPLKPGSSTLNFADLLKLAEKKQYEPVELKPKITKEERLRTAEEIKELEIERRAKRRINDPTTQSSSTTVRKNMSEKEKKNCKPQKSVLERPTQSCGMKKKPQSTPSSKASTGERERDRPKTIVPSKATSSQVSTKQGMPKPSSSHASIISSELRLKKESTSSVQGRPSGIPQTRPSATSVRDFKSPNGNLQKTKLTQGSSLMQEHKVVNHKSGKGEPPRSGNPPTVKSTGNSVVRPSSSGRPKEGNRPQPRPRGTPQAKAGASSLHGHPAGTGGQPPGFGQGRGASGGALPNRQPSGNFGSGHGRPKCTVVSETISSKNMGGPRPGIPPRPGMPKTPGMAPRPGGPTRPLNRPPGTMLPPITIAYKRKYEEEDEYDSDMEDFIDDGDDEQEEVSRHIKEIFGYDRNKYKDESDYALKFMESSWQDMQKEEAKSLRMAVQEDLEEERKEQEELNKKNAKRKK